MAVSLLRSVRTLVALHLFLLMTSHVALTRAQAGAVTFHVAEEQLSGTLVGNVAQASNITRDVSASLASSLQYQILSTSSELVSRFSINASTGVIYTNARIDREQVCNRLLLCQLQFTVAVMSGPNLIKYLPVKVIIDDINDNAPAFLTSETNLTISESASLETKIPVSGAFDRDAGLATPLIYSLQGPSVFELSEERQLDGSGLKLVIKQPLDRESVPSYVLLILASDGNDSASHTGTLTVNVQISDVNDNAPAFTADSFNVTVTETTPVGAVFGRLTARDADAGVNAELSFRFGILTQAEVTDLFQLDETSGELSTKAELQYQSGRLFQCVVEVWDHGSPNLYNQTLLRISVLDAGNTPPRLELTLVEPTSDPRSTQVYENVPLGSFVATLKVDDFDEGSEAEVNCSSLEPHFRLQPFEEKSYGVVVSKELDHEESDEVNVRIVCSDGGTPSLSSFANFTVTVLDVNDNPPQFTQPVYSARVRENVSGTQPVVQVLALDRDGYQNNQVSYSLDEASRSLFTVDATSGWIWLNSSVDRELTPSLAVTVLATDSGIAPRTGTATVSVLVEDVNDNAPYLNKTDYYVSEAAPIGYVFDLQVADDDEGTNAEVVVSVPDEDFGSASPFTVLPNGSVEVNRRLDREAQEESVVAVILRDKGRPSLTGSGTLTIRVVQPSDQPVSFVFPSATNRTAWVDAGARAGFLVCRVVATVGQLGAQPNVVYGITEGNARGTFSINRRSGEVFVAQDLLPVAGATVRLKLSAGVAGDANPVTHSDLDVVVGPANASLFSARAAASAQESYVIVAAIIGGVTLVIAVVVIGVIIHLRTTDLRRMRAAKDRAAKPDSVLSQKAVAAVCADPAPRAESDANRKAVPGSEKFADDSRVVSSGPSGQKQTAALTKEALEIHSSPSFLPLPEGRRHHLVIEDHNSDASGDTTTCDSGRGASDEEVVYPPPEPYTGYFPPPRVPPRQPLQWSHDVYSVPDSWRMASAGEAYRHFPDDTRDVITSSTSSRGDVMSRTNRPSQKVPFSSGDGFPRHAQVRGMLSAQDAGERENTGADCRYPEDWKNTRRGHNARQGRNSGASTSSARHLRQDRVSERPVDDQINSLARFSPPGQGPSRSRVGSGGGREERIRSPHGATGQVGEERSPRGAVAWPVDGSASRGRQSTSVSSLAQSVDDDDNTTTTSGSYSIDFDDVTNMSLEC